ncbi:MAG: response regulator transcription factor [Acidobacteriia bacterium]|nr:response regulator transcription factor [Terriglobia bacterium]
MSVRVFLVDDHAVLRDALKVLLEKHGLTVVGEAENGAQAVQMARSARPQVMVMDLSMPVMNGIEAATEIQRESGTPTILLTMHSDEQHVLRAFRAGIAGYVLKSKAASDLVQAIHEVIRGNVYLSPGVSGTVVREMLNKDAAQSEALTLRERQVLQLIAEGKTTKEVAQVLGVSVRTGESHRARIMEKLEIHETAGLVRYAIRQGLIEP